MNSAGFISNLKLEEDRMEQLIAFCGLDCACCEAYIATQADDLAAKERLVVKWREEYNAPEMTIASVTCDGCTTKNGRTGGYCSHCAIRACGVERLVENCAHCADYSTCNQLAGFFTSVPTAKATLDAIRLTL
jgi:hypothetical protein